MFVKKTELYFFFYSIVKEILSSLTKTSLRLHDLTYYRPERILTTRLRRNPYTY